VINKEIEELAKSFQDLDTPAQFARSFELDIPEDQIDLLFSQLLKDPTKYVWALRGLAANPLLGLHSLEQCIYSPIYAYLFAIQNPRLQELKQAHSLPLHQIESVRNALGQHDAYQALLEESSSADTSQHRFAELAAMNLTSGAYIAFWHDREAAEGRRQDLFFEPGKEEFVFSDAAESILQEFIELDASPEYPELLWRVQANRSCSLFPSATINYLDEHLEFENLRDVLHVLPARLAFVISGEGENYDETWPMAQMEYSTFDLDIEDALRIAHPSTPDSVRVATINELISDAAYDPNELDENNNWITLLSAILYTQDTELLESIAQGDNDLWKLAVILNPSATHEIVVLADDFEGEFSLEDLTEVDFFHEMVEYAIQTHDLEAATHWESLAGVSDNLDGDDEDFDDEDDG
jgi:hypothetical protein